jgi:hypothetical protein
LRPAAPLLFAAASGTVLTAVVLLLVRTPGPQDEHTFADQRNGLIANGPHVPARVGGIAFGDRPVVLLFLRGAASAAAVQTWQEDLPGRVRVFVVLQRPGVDPPPELAGSPTVIDAQRVLGDVVHLPRARDGGPGVGYAVVDSGRVVRYATLDPRWSTNGFEVATIAKAVR